MSIKYYSHSEASIIMLCDEDDAQLQEYGNGLNYGYMINNGVVTHVVNDAAKAENDSINKDMIEMYPGNREKIEYEMELMEEIEIEGIKHSIYPVRQPVEVSFLAQIMNQAKDMDILPRGLLFEKNGLNFEDHMGICSAEMASALMKHAQNLISAKYAPIQDYKELAKEGRDRKRGLE